MLYLDASVLVPLIVRETTSDDIRRWLEIQDTVLYVGRLAIGEVGSAVSRRRRMGELSDDLGIRALGLFDDWARGFAKIVDHEPGDLIDAAGWIRRPLPKLLMPDAIHLATCRRLGASFVTADKNLTIVADLLRVVHVFPTQGQTT